MDNIFCYHCRRYHPQDEMRRILTNGRWRWRCLSSLAGVRASREARDAFGKAATRQAKSEERRPLPHCVRELMAPAACRSSL